MLMVIAVLLVCLDSAVAVNMFQLLLRGKFEALYVWSAGAIFLNASMNPAGIYLVRNNEIRNAEKSIICFWLLTKKDIQIFSGEFVIMGLDVVK